MKFTKDDLKTGMICLHRNGDYSMVFKNTFERYDILVIEGHIQINLDKFDCINFKYHYSIDTKKCEKTFDIVKIFKPLWDSEGFVIFNTDFMRRFKEKGKEKFDLWELLWEEKDEVEMTMEEVCKALGKNIKIVK